MTSHSSEIPDCFSSYLEMLRVLVLSLWRQTELRSSCFHLNLLAWAMLEEKVCIWWLGWAACGVLVTLPFLVWARKVLNVPLSGGQWCFSWFSFCAWYPFCRNSHTFDPVWGKEGNQPLLQQWNRPNTVAGSRRQGFAVYCCKIQSALILATLLACHPIQKGTTL